MSTGSPAPMPHPQHPKSSDSDANIWGIIGLIMGLFGFFTYITAPVGLVMSYMGMKHPRNGIAIAGLVVSIISTIYAIVVVVILVVWFGVIAAMCGSSCFCLGLASDEMALQRAVQDRVAEELELSSFEVRINGFSSSPPFSGDEKTFTGTAVYSDDSGTEMAIDFSGDAEKVDGQWEVNSLILEGEPYEWFEPFADDEFTFDDQFDTPAEAFDNSIEGIDGTELDGSAIDGSAPPDDTFNREAPPEDDPFADPES